MTSQIRSPGQGGIAAPPRLRTGTGPAGVPAATGATTPGAGTGPVGGMPAGLVQRVLGRLAANGSVASDTVGLRAAVAEALAEDGIVLSPLNLAAIVTSVGDELTGLGPLAPLLADPAVTDVLVNGPTEVWVERGGTIERAAVRFPSAAAVAALVQRVVAPLGLRVDESRPWVDARLPGGERFHAVLPPLAPDGPVVTIRTFARRRLRLRDLIERDALDEVTARLLEAMVAAGIAIAVSGGTGNAWANPRPAETPPRRLIIEGGFGVDGGRSRRLDQRARVLGFEDLHGYLQARCDAGSSIPRIATELGVGDWQVQAALSRLAVRLAHRRQRLAAQRRRHTEERIAARVAQLGFTDAGAYLVDRVVARGWLLAEVAAELAAHRLTVRRLLDRYGIRRVRRTPAERAAADQGRRVQAVGWQARRAARLAELGFADLAGYLHARRVEQGWSVKRMRAELRVGRQWLVGELTRLGLRP